MVFRLHLFLLPSASAENNAFTCTSDTSFVCFVIKHKLCNRCTDLLNVVGAMFQVYVKVRGELNEMVIIYERVLFMRVWIRVFNRECRARFVRSFEPSENFRFHDKPIFSAPTGISCPMKKIRFQVIYFKSINVYKKTFQTSWFWIYLPTVFFCLGRWRIQSIFFYLKFWPSSMFIFKTFFHN